MTLWSLPLQAAESPFFYKCHLYLDMQKASGRSDRGVVIEAYHLQRVQWTGIYSTQHHDCPGLWTDAGLGRIWKRPDWLILWWLRVPATSRIHEKSFENKDSNSSQKMANRARGKVSCMSDRPLILFNCSRSRRSNKLGSDCSYEIHEWFTYMFR
jgi:hypothetical protein